MHNPQLINSNIIEADARKEPPELMKQLYLKQNIFNIELDTPIFRIVQTTRIIEDIQSNRLSHTNIGPDIWGDPAENPLLDKVFKDVASGEKIYLDSLVADLYGVSWSLAPVPTREAWSYFSYSSDSVRIQTTPRKLLEAAMELKNPYYMLQHFIGKVEYIEEKVFDSFFDDNNFSKYLDSHNHRKQDRVCGFCYAF